MDGPKNSTALNSPPVFSSRQKAFIKHYAVCRNGSEAARLAGYSIPSANRIASRLLSNVHIREAADREMAWEFEDWCKSVKSIFHNEKTWQAQLRSLELYGKAKGWLRDSIEVGINVVQAALEDAKHSRTLAAITHAKPLLLHNNTIIDSQPNCNSTNELRND